jgi:hypothetical protein
MVAQGDALGYPISPLRGYAALLLFSLVFRRARSERAVWIFWYT